MATDLPSVVAYLGALRAGRPVALIDPAAPGLPELVGQYAPAVVTGVGGAAVDGYRDAELSTVGPAWLRIPGDAPPPHPDLALLLPTSGSTGSPKLVRLAGSALLANAESIALALHIDAAEIAVTSLPLYYSYGMSVLNTHLLRGATVVLERQGLVAREFWTAVTTYDVTSIAAVPYQYEMLKRLRFDPARYPSVRTLTQAGGRLRPELISDFHARMGTVGGSLYVMYGQTEAGPRMTTLPSERLPEKLGSVGPALSGGRLSVVPGTEEIIYRGPNVMMGYAQSAADLARGDEVGGELATGDLGHLDDEEYLFITGRAKRIGKIFGVRVNLDEVERLLTDRGPIAAVPGDDRLVIFAEAADAELLGTIRSELAERLGTHSSGLDVRSVDALPLLPNGKLDYRALEALR